MKKRIAAALALLLLASGIAACKGKPSGTDESGTGGGYDTVFAPATGTGEAATTSPAATDPDGASETLPETDTRAGEETGTASAPAETDTETEPAHIRVPAGEPADLTPILRGESAGYDMQYNFAGASLNALRADANLRFSQSGDMTAGEQGLTVPADRWAAVGFARSMNAPCTVTARVGATNPTGAAKVTSAVMLGLRCTDAGHIYTDSGLWIIVRDKAVFACLGGDTTPVQLAVNLPAGLDAGVSLRAEDDGSVLRVFVEETAVATARFSDTAVRLFNAAGTEVASAGLNRIAHGANLGYTRILSHNTNGCLSALSAVSKVSASYATTAGTVALKAERDYLFRDKVQYSAALPTVRVDGHYLADAQALATLFGFSYSINGNTATLSRRLLTLTFRAGEDSVVVNGVASPFPTVVRRGNGLLLCADWLAPMLGYTALCGEDTLYIFPDAAQDAERLTAVMDERYRLYETTVYDRTTPDFDKTGVGKYTATDPAARLVGIAYTAGHTAAKSWGSAARPLLGAYTSDDREIIYRHGVWLAAAGVDFVYVDWSRNTLYDPDTAGDKRSEYRTIEETTDLLFEIWSSIPGAPRICILLGPGTTGQMGIAGGSHQRKADQVYRAYAEKYPDLYFCYEGKPLLLCYGGTPARLGTNPDWKDDRFTVRWMTDYAGVQTALIEPADLTAPVYWTRRDRDAQVLSVRGRLAEAVSCSAAWNGQGKEGDTAYVAACGFESGETLRRQFARADALGARIALVSAWNEWSAASLGFSADLEPSDAEGTFRYDLLCELIRQFKS